MGKRFVLTGFGVSAIVVGVLIAGLAIGVVASQGAPQGQAPQVTQATQGGQAGPGGQPVTTPCGPNIQGTLGTNTAPNSRCFELRMYTVDPTRDGVGQFKGGIDDLHKRFREGEVEVFKKSGVEVLAVWQNLDDPNTLIYLLAYKDRAARDAGWAAFGADAKCTELRTKYFVPL